MKNKFFNFKKPTSVVLAIALIATLILGSFAFFSDRVDDTLKISTASFDKDGYKISREYNDVYYKAGEDIKVKVTEDNGKSEKVESVVTMSVKWVSPDTSTSPFGNANASDNATITVDGAAVSYTVNQDGSITFKLPEHEMNASSKGNEREIVFHIPESLKSTGKLNFTFDKVELAQVTSMGGNGFSAEFSHDELNADSSNPMDFTATVIWDFSKNQDKSVIGYLTGNTGNYGIKVEGSGAMYDWASESSSKQSNYKGSVTSLDLGSGLTTTGGLTTIGDHAFDGFNKVTSLNIPANVTTIGDSAFENLAIKSLTIPSGVTALGEMAFGNIEEVTEITFNGNPQFPAAGEGTGAFYVDAPYSESDSLRTKVNGNSENALNYNWAADHRGYVVTVKTAEGGTMTAAPTVAINGKSITLSPVADKAYEYNGATVKYTDASGDEKTISVSKDEVTFTMPAADVTVTPIWKLTIPPMLAAQDTWYTQGDTEVDPTKITSITFKDSYEPASYVDSWDASQDEVGTVTAYVENDGKGGYKLTIAGNGYGLIFANEDSSYAFYGFEAVTQMIGIDLLDTRHTTTMSSMFEDCYELTSLDVSHFNTSKVTDISYMFDSCSSLESMNFATHAATAKDGTSYTAWDTSKVEVASFFLSMYSAPVEDAKYALTSVDMTGWDTSSMLYPDRLFMSNWNLTEVKGISEWKTDTFETVQGIFYGCSSLESIDISKWNTSNVECTRDLFNSCTSLKAVDISGWDLSKVTDSREMFTHCYSLTELTIPATLSVFSQDFASHCPNLTTITFLQPADLEITFPEAGSSKGAFYVDDNMDDENPVVYTETDPLRTKVVTGNADVLSYDWTTDCRGYTVTAETVTGGSLKATPSVAINGKTVTLTPTANDQYNYKGATVTYTESGTKKTISLAADKLTFTMPAADVKITPEWTVSARPMLAAQDTWQYTDEDSTPIDFSLLKTINIVDTYEPDGTETSWDASANETVDGVAYNGKVTAYLSSDKKTLTVAGNGYGEIYANPDSSWALSSSYSGMAELTRINGAENLNTSLVTDASSMFSMNSKLEYVNVSNWDTSNIEFTNYSGYYGMFMNCAALKDLDVSKWDTGSMIETRRMFSGCTSLDVIDVSDWDMSSCETMYAMFAETAISTIAVDDWNTSSLYDTYNMFEGCKNLTEINLSKWDVSKLDDASEMFMDSGLTKIDLSAWNESVVTNVSSMFEGCEDLTDVNIVGWNLSNLEVDTNDSYSSSAGMFAGCTSLEELTIPSSLKVFGRKFAYGCTNLTNIEFQHSADADLTFATAGSTYGAFYVGDPYSATAPLRTKVTTSNTDVLGYAWNTDNRGYTITFETVSGGTLSAAPAIAINGKTVTLTPTANNGYAYNGATVSYTDASGSAKTIDLDATTKTFTMPDVDVKITPKWSVTNYTITYNLNNGTLADDAVKNFNVNTATFNLPTPTKTGYSFGGWYTASDLSGSAVTQIAKGSTGNKTFYAKWNANSYTVKFNGNGSTSGSMTDLAMTYGTAKNLTANAFSKTGYSFNGWNTKADGSGTAYADKVSVNNLTSSSGGSVTLYAQWKINTYSITYNANGGSGVSNGTYTYETATFNLPTPTRSGYTFGGWYTDANYSGSAVTQITKNSTGNKTFYAKWNAVSYSITYNENGGSTVADGTYTIETATFNLPTTTKTGYSFGGWYTASDLSGSAVTQIAKGSTGNKTFYAKWNAYSYTVKFDGNGSTSGSMTDLAMTYGTAKNLTANAFSKTGYSFNGWNTKADGSGTAYADKVSVNNLTSSSGGSVTLYAQWKINTYSITYNANGGSGVSNGTYTYETATFNLPTPTRSGYTFGGWYTASDLSGTAVTQIAKGSTGNKTFYAKWNANSYTVKFNGNGSTSGSMTDLAMTYGTAKNLTANAFSKTGYSFNGWNTKADGSGTAYADKAEVINLSVENGGTVDLYAQWELVPEAFAIYSATDNSLRFYKNGDATPTAGSTYKGRAVTAVYTGFESATYGSGGTPWYSNRNNITSVVFEDEIKPVSTAYWFYNITNCGSFDVNKLNTSDVTDMRSTFQMAGQNANIFEIIGLSGWDTSKVTTMQSMFNSAGENATTWDIGDISGWNTAKVTSFNNMYIYAGSKAATFSVNMSGWDTSSVTDVFAMFNNTAKSATTVNLNLSGWNLAKVTSTNQMFFYTAKDAKTININVSGWNTSNITNMYGTFYYVGSNTATDPWELDLSSWDTSKVTSMDAMFSGCTKLWKVTFGEKWTWVGTGGYLPAQTNANIPGADGQWYDTETDIGYAPANVHKNVKETVTYVAVKPPEAFAVYSATDKSLRFYNNGDATPTAGSTYKGRAVTAVYTGFETNTSGYVYRNTPWYSYGSSITTVVVEDEISPVNTKYWFHDFTVCSSFDLSKLNTSKVTNMQHMFNTAGDKVTTFALDLSGWDTSKVMDMMHMFFCAAEHSTSVTLNLSGWDTSSVTNMRSMFSRTGQYATTFNLIGLTGWDTSNVTDMKDMFSNAGYSASYSLDVSGWNVSKVTTYENFNFRVKSKVIAPSSFVITWDMRQETEDKLDDSTVYGSAITISSMPDVAALNEEAAVNAAENMEHYGWLLETSFGSEEVSLEDFESVLASVYEDGSEYDMTITPLYKAIEKHQEEATETEEEPVAEEPIEFQYFADNGSIVTIELDTEDGYDVTVEEETETEPEHFIISQNDEEKAMGTYLNKEQCEAFFSADFEAEGISGFESGETEHGSYIRYCFTDPEAKVSIWNYVISFNEAGFGIHFESFVSEDALTDCVDRLVYEFEIFNCMTDGCTLGYGHEGFCNNEEIPTECETEGCTLDYGHDGDCNNEETPTDCETDGCTLGYKHEGDCNNEVTPTDCKTEGCTLGYEHEGDCNNEVTPTDCETEGCTLGYEHEGDCSNAIAPASEDPVEPESQEPEAPAEEPVVPEEEPKEEPAEEPEAPAEEPEEEPVQEPEAPAEEPVVPEEEPETPVEDPEITE